MIPKPGTSSAREAPIIALAEHFLMRDSQSLKKHFTGISKEAKAYLLVHSRPGNVRELANAIERAAIIGHITTIILPSVFGDTSTLSEVFRLWLSNAELRAEERFIAESNRLAVWQSVRFPKRGGSCLSLDAKHCK